MFANIITSGGQRREQTDIGLFVRVILVNTIGIIAGACLLAFGILDTIQGIQPTGGVIVVAGLLVVGNFFFLRRTGKIKPASWVAAGLLWAGFAFLLSTGGSGNTGPLWIYTLPGSLLILVGIKIGSGLTALFFLYSAITLFVPDSPLLFTSYPPEFTQRFIPTLLTATALGYVFEYMRIASQRAILRTTEQEKEHILLLDSVLDAIPDLIGIQDLDHRIIRYNQAGYDFLDISPEEAIGKCCYQLIGRNEPCRPCATAKAIETKKPAHVERYFDGLKLWLDCRSYPVLDDKGTILYIVEHLRDITSRKTMEAEALRAQKLESLGTLAGGIAHDFNNILTAILGNISCARMELAADSETTRDLAEAERACLQAKNLTQQLLTFSRGGQPVKNSLRAENLVREATKLALSGSNCRAEFSFAPGLWTIEADPGQLHQAISNIVLNAAQAMPQGGTILVSAVNTTIDEESESALPPGNYVEVAIRDEGSGIPPQYLEKVFDPYFTTRPTGTGLGLATAYSIVKNHGGALGLESSEGNGTTAFLHFPATRSLGPGGKPGQGNPRKAGGGRGRILVMDDDARVREVVERMLQHLGYEVSAVSDGKDAIEDFRRRLAEGNPYAAVILDLTVPGGMGGKEALRKIRKLSASIPVVVSSGYSTEGTMSRFAEEGFTGVLAKPYRLNELAEVLSDCLSLDRETAG